MKVRLQKPRYAFAQASGAKESVITTRTIEKELKIHGRKVVVYPSAAYCYVLGRNITAPLHVPVATSPEPGDDE
jgi:hypothetical protein